MLALVHTVFNLAGIIVLYVPPFLRPLPVYAAEKFADIAVSRRAWAVAYIVGAFIVIPLIGVAVFR